MLITSKDTSFLNNLYDLMADPTTLMFNDRLSCDSLKVCQILVNRYSRLNYFDSSQLHSY